MGGLRDIINHFSESMKNMNFVLNDPDSKYIHEHIKYMFPKIRKIKKHNDDDFGRPGPEII